MRTGCFFLGMFSFQIHGVVLPRTPSNISLATPAHLSYPEDPVRIRASYDQIRALLAFCAHLQAPASKSRFEPPAVETTRLASMTSLDEVDNIVMAAGGSRHRQPVMTSASRESDDSAKRQFDDIDQPPLAVMRTKQRVTDVCLVSLFCCAIFTPKAYFLFANQQLRAPAMF